MSNNGLNIDQIEVRSYGTKVVVLKNGLLVAELGWHEAKQLGQALQTKSREAEAVHWQQVKRKLGHEAPIKSIMGIPLLTEAAELERMG